MGAWEATYFSKQGEGKLKLLGRVRLCDPMGYSLSGSSIHGISHARILGRAGLLQ